MKKLDNNFNGVVLSGTESEIKELIVQGYASFEQQEFHKVDSKFLICSISKMFTAIAINQLSEQGILSKRDLIDKYIPEYFKGEGISIYHLLTHTSGIPNFIMYRKEIDLKTSYDASEILSKMDKIGLKFKPGTKWSYCNTGYYILALIIEKVTNIKYERYIKENIFDVVKMENSSFITDDKTVFVPSHVKNKHRYDMNPTLLFGAGDIICSAGDLYLFAKGILEGKLVDNATLKEMWTPVFSNKKIQYGEGVFLNNHFGTKMIGHSGSLPTGYSTQLSIYPDKKLINVVLSNNRRVLNPLVYVDANSKYVEGCLMEEILEKKVGVIRKAYL